MSGARPVDGAPGWILSRHPLTSTLLATYEHDSETRFTVNLSWSTETVHFHSTAHGPTHAAVPMAVFKALLKHHCDNTL